MALSGYVGSSHIFPVHGGTHKKTKLVSHAAFYTVCRRIGVWAYAHILTRRKFFPGSPQPRPSSTTSQLLLLLVVPDLPGLLPTNEANARITEGTEDRTYAAEKKGEMWGGEKRSMKNDR